MKPETNFPTDASTYYARHRVHAARLLVALLTLSWALIGSIVAALYAATMLAIWLVLMAVFLTIICVVEFRIASQYYDKHLYEIVRFRTVFDCNRYKN